MGHIRRMITDRPRWWLSNFTLSRSSLRRPFGFRTSEFALLLSGFVASLLPTLDSRPLSLSLEANNQGGEERMVRSPALVCSAIQGQRAGATNNKIPIYCYVADFELPTLNFE